MTSENKAIQKDVTIKKDLDGDKVIQKDFTLKAFDGDVRVPYETAMRLPTCEMLMKRQEYSISINTTCPIAHALLESIDYVPLPTDTRELARIQTLAKFLGIDIPTQNESKKETKAKADLRVIRVKNNIDGVYRFKYGVNRIFISDVCYKREIDDDDDISDVKITYKAQIHLANKVISYDGWTHVYDCVDWSGNIKTAKIWKSLFSHLEKELKTQIDFMVKK